MSSIVKRKGYGSQKKQIFGVDQNYSNSLNKIFKQAVSGKKQKTASKIQTKKKTAGGILSKIFDTPDEDSKDSEKTSTKTRKAKNDPFDFQKTGTLVAEKNSWETTSRRFGLGIRRTKASIAQNAAESTNESRRKKVSSGVKSSSQTQVRTHRKLITAKNHPVKLKTPAKAVKKLENAPKKFPCARKTVPSRPKRPAGNIARPTKPLRKKSAPHKLQTKIASSRKRPVVKSQHKQQRSSGPTFTGSISPPKPNSKQGIAFKSKAMSVSKLRSKPKNAAAPKAETSKSKSRVQQSKLSRATNTRSKLEARPSKLRTKPTREAVEQKKAIAKTMPLIKQSTALSRLRAKRDIAVSPNMTQLKLKVGPRNVPPRRKDLSVFDFQKRTLDKEAQIGQKEPLRKRRRMNARERAALKKEEEVDVFDFPFSPLTKVREAHATAKLQKTLNPRKRKRIQSEPARIKRKKPNEPRDVCSTGISVYQPLHLRKQPVILLRRTPTLLKQAEAKRPVSKPPRLKKSHSNPPKKLVKRALSNPLPKKAKPKAAEELKSQPKVKSKVVEKAKAPPKIKKVTSAPPPSLSSVFCSQPIIRRQPSQPAGPPKPVRAKSESAIAEMRKKNLSMKSNSTLLLDFLVQRDSQPLQKARQAALGDDFQYCIPFSEDKPVVDGVKSIGRLTRDDVKVVNYLLSQGADPDVMDEDGLVPLVVAIHYTRCYEVVKLLVDRNADVTIDFSFCGREPLSLIDIAINMNLPKVAKLFLERGALPTKHFVERFETKFMDFAGTHDFLEEAEESFRERVWVELDSDSPDLEIIDAMCTHGLDPDECRRNECISPLYFVVKNQTNVELVRILLSAGSDPNEKDDRDTPMICYPILKTGPKMYEILSLLLEFEVDLSVQVDGMPLLEFAELHSSDKRCLERIKAKVKQKNG